MAQKWDSKQDYLEYQSRELLLHQSIQVIRTALISTLWSVNLHLYEGGPKKNEIFSWAIDLFKELQKIH